MLKLDIPRKELIRKAEAERAALVAENATATKAWKAAVAAYPAQAVAYLRAQADAAERGVAVRGRRKRTGLYLRHNHNGHVEFEPLAGTEPPEHPGSAPVLHTTAIDKALAFLRMSTTDVVKTTQCELDDFLSACCKARR